MRIKLFLKTSVIAGAMFASLSFASAPAWSNDVIINGQLMPPAAIMQIERMIGQVLPSGAYGWDGSYLYDAYGTAVPLSLGGTGPQRYSGGSVGEVYSDGSSAWGNQNTGIGGVYDPSGGCEAGSCVNILD